eukprot:1506576-Rhodomonas_salina.2
MVATLLSLVIAEGLITEPLHEIPKSSNPHSSTLSQVYSYLIPFSTLTTLLNMMMFSPNTAKQMLSVFSQPKPSYDSSATNPTSLTSGRDVAEGDISLFKRMVRKLGNVGKKADRTRTGDPKPKETPHERAVRLEKLANDLWSELLDSERKGHLVMYRRPTTIAAMEKTYNLPHTQFAPEILQYDTPQVQLANGISQAQLQKSNQKRLSSCSSSSSLSSFTSAVSACDITTISMEFQAQDTRKKTCTPDGVRHHQEVLAEQQRCNQVPLTDEERGVSTTLTQSPLVELGLIQPNSNLALSQPFKLDVVQ